MNCPHIEAVELLDRVFPSPLLARVDIRFAWIFGTTLMFREHGEMPPWIPAHTYGFKATDSRWRQ